MQLLNGPKENMTSRRDQVLGLLLFLLYVDNLFKAIANMPTLILFVDKPSILIINLETACLQNYLNIAFEEWRLLGCWAVWLL
jgi:hypothetical protein